MKITLITLGIVALAAVVVVSGLWVGAAWAQGRFGGARTGYGPMGPGRMGYGIGDVNGYGTTCGTSGVPRGVSRWGLCDGGSATPDQAEVTSLDEAKAAVERYVQNLGYTGLEVKEVMAFERNYYAIVSEEDTGIGAMELLVDKDTGAVGPEPGPNMMWNAKYGMMAGSWMGRGGMMGRGRAVRGTGEMTVSAAEAEDVAQRWLDANLPGRTAGEADPFYGYYTLHFLKDGEMDGMLSVHGSTGDVWYHSWHGDFIEMMEETG